MKMRKAMTMHTDTDMITAVKCAAAAACAALLLALLPGCGGAQRAGDALGDDEAGGGGAAAKTIVVGLQADGSTLDPHKATDAGSKRLLENLYSSLFRYAPTYGDVVPDLAKSYAWSDDKRTLTLQLVDNAHFHSGRAVEAADVKYSLERMRDQGVQAEQFKLLTGIETPDAHTVVLQLAEPLSPLITWLADPMNAIVDRKVVEANDGSIDRVDAGCGPFKLAEWKKDLRCKLVRHGDYHVKGLPKLDSIVYRPIPDDTAMLTALRNGEIDMIFDVSAKTGKSLERVEGIKVESVPGTFWEYVGLNTASAPLDNVKLRQAIATAVDRGALNKLVKFGKATVLDGGHIPPGHWAYADDLHLYPAPDLARAKALIAESGVATPIKLELKVGSDFAYQVQTAQVIKQQLRPIGIEVTVTAMESQVFFDQLGKGDFQMTVVGWLGFVDPDEWTYKLFHSGGTFNQQGYADDQVDAWLEAGRRTTERQARFAIYRQIQEKVATDAPMVFLFANPRVAAMRPRVKGFVTHPTVSSIFLRDTTVAAE